MQTKNPIYNSSGGIDMEIDHPVYGWIPFSASPNDTEQLGRDLYAEAVAGTLGAILPYVTPPLYATLAEAIAGQTAVLYKSCGAAITAGFTSSALGSPYTYPTQPIDQSNLVGAVTASLQPGLASTWTVKFWCATQPAAPAVPAWAMLPHTAAQIQQVLADGVAQRETYSAKLDSLIAQLNQSTTIADAEAVAW